MPSDSVSSTAVSPRALAGSPAAEEKFTLAILLLPGQVAECHLGKWIPVSDLLAHLIRGIDLTSSDRDYGGFWLAQAKAVVPRVQAYRTHAAERRNTAPALDLLAVASLQHQIERLLRERHLQLAAKIIDQLNLALQTGSIAPTLLALTLEEVRDQVTPLFLPRVKGIQLAQENDPLIILPPDYIASILPSLNRGCLRIDQYIHS